MIHGLYSNNKTKKSTHASNWSRNFFLLHTGLVYLKLPTLILEEDKSAIQSCLNLFITCLNTMFWNASLICLFLKQSFLNCFFLTVWHKIDVFFPYYIHLIFSL